MDLTKLSDPFEPSLVSWRVGSTTSDKKRGLALAYIDARDVMARLDEVVGTANWQDRYEFPGKRTICYLSVRIDGEWVTKADGAGDSDVEAEKGAISDALKRAAVKWGIGRYLYDVESPWVELEPAGRSFKIKDGEKRKLEDALRKGLPRREDRTDLVPVTSGEQKERTPGGRERKPGPRLTDEGDAVAICEVLIENALKQPDPDRLGAWWKGQAKQIGSLPDKQYDQFASAVEKHKAELMAQRVAS